MKITIRGYCKDCRRTHSWQEGCVPTTLKTDQRCPTCDRYWEPLGTTEPRNVEIVNAKNRRGSFRPLMFALAAAVLTFAFFLTLHQTAMDTAKRAAIPKPPLPCLNMSMADQNPDICMFLPTGGTAIYCKPPNTNLKDWLENDVPTINKDLGYRLCPLTSR